MSAIFITLKIILLVPYFVTKQLIHYIAHSLIQKYLLFNTDVMTPNKILVIVYN